MEAIIERLKEEKAQAETDYYQKGEEAGLAWAKSASYMDLAYARKFDPCEDGQYNLQAIFSDDVLSDYFTEVFDEHPVMKPADGDDYFDDIAEKWLNGWFEGVYDFWKEVNAQL